jgi:hypothetical protein
MLWMFLVGLSLYERKSNNENSKSAEILRALNFQREKCKEKREKRAKRKIKELHVKKHMRRSIG